MERGEKELFDHSKKSRSSIKVLDGTASSGDNEAIVPPVTKSDKTVAEEDNKKVDATERENGPKEKIEECFRPFKGLSASAVGALAASTVGVLVKYLKNISVFGMVTARFSIMLVIAIFLVWHGKQKIFPEGKRRLLLGVSFLGVFYIGVGFFAMKHVPLGDAGVVLSCSTFFTCIIARIFLKEPIEKLNLFNILLVIGGLILIVQPPVIFANGSNIYFDDSQALYGIIGLTFCAVFIQSSLYVCLRSLKDVNSSTVLLSFSVVGTVSGLILTLILDVYYQQSDVKGGLPSTVYEWLLLACIGLVSYLSQCALTISLQTEAAGCIALMRKAFELIFSYVFQIAVFKQMPNVYGVGGILLICFALILSSLKKVLDEILPADHKIKTIKSRALTYLKLFYSKKDQKDQTPEVDVENPKIVDLNSIKSSA